MPGGNGLPGGGQVTQRVRMVMPPYSLPQASAAARTHKWDHMFSWISLARRSLLYSRPAGAAVTVNSDVVDALNAGHAARAMAVTRSEAAEHLRRSGTAISQLVVGCTAADLQPGNGRVERLAQIAIRNHRAYDRSEDQCDHRASR